MYNNFGTNKTWIKFLFLKKLLFFSSLWLLTSSAVLPTVSCINSQQDDKDWDSANPALLIFDSTMTNYNFNRNVCEWTTFGFYLVFHIGDAAPTSTYEFTQETGLTLNKTTGVITVTVKNDFTSRQYSICASVLVGN